MDWFAPIVSRVTENTTPRDAARAYADLFPAVYLRFHRRDAKRSALSGASHGVMLHLAQTGPLSIGECARHLGRAQSVITEIVAGLEKHGLLARIPGAKDRRRTEVWLTDAGRARLEREQEVLERALVEKALARMAPRTRAALIEGTRALVAAAEANGNETRRRR
jgi:DNA-binding MarR family transcriptional regulator